MYILNDYEKLLLNEAIMGRVCEVSKKAKHVIDFEEDISHEIIDLMNLLNKLLNYKDDSKNNEIKQS